MHVQQGATMRSIRRSVRLILSTAALGAAGPVLAAQSAPDTDDYALEEVVVTATRQSDSVNRVALAVTAQTQEQLDQRGILDIADLEGVVPGLRLSGREASGNVNVAIRGIRQQSATAATTGFYLDETSLQKRSAAAFASQNGTPVPPLFDLERVEVLRGPQGTLFGGGSEGGTIRYIQARPSLTEYSGYGRAQWMSTKGGDPSYEGGVAFGGPLVEGKLGFRASIFARKTGGYIDLTDYRTNEIYDENANSGNVRAGRLAMTWKPTDRTELTLQYMKSVDKTDQLGGSYNLSEPGQLQVDPVCFNRDAIINAPTPGDRSIVIALPGPACFGIPNGYLAPGYTVGPFELERFQSLAMGRTPTRTDMEIGSGTFEWQVRDDLKLTSVSSFTTDLSRGQSPQNFPVGFVLHVAGTARVNAPGENTIPVIFYGVGYNPNITGSVDGLGLGAIIRTNTNNRRNVFSQELRLASAPENTLSYVVGAYYSNARARVTQYAEASDEGFQQLSGTTISERYGIPFEGFFSNIYESIQDVEQAAFADVTWRATDKLRLSAGVRVTYVTTSYTQSNYGPNAFAASPLDTLVTGSVSETPVTPKLSAQYFITPESQVYFTAAKGFRPGGVNQALTSAADGFLLQQYGLTRDVLPRTYDSDTVWSYELGGKTGFWDGRAQVNAAIYNLDWKNVQTYVFMGDGAVFNVPKARSRGVEVEAQVRPVRPLTLNAAVQRTEAKYTSSLVIPQGTLGGTGDMVVAQDGQKFFQPTWTVNLGAQYSFNFSTVGNGYFRVDYRWFDDYLTAIPGTPTYSPDSSRIPSQGMFNLRLGLQWDAFDVNLFALNATDVKKGGMTGGRSQCTNADCSEFQSYAFGRTINAPTPRQVGVQLTWRP
jgi:iron complex outermembrane receptor protein